MVTFNEAAENAVLCPIVKTYFDLEPPVSVELINEGYNQTYLMRTTDRAQFILRIYLNNKYYIQDSDDFRFELQLLEHLECQAVPVASAIKNKQGEYLSSYNFKDEIKYFAVFKYAAGMGLEKLSLESHEISELGKTIAALHESADQFDCAYSRYSLDLSNLLIEPLNILKRYLVNSRKSDLTFFSSTYERLKHKIEATAVAKANHGLIHGDLNASNIYFDKKSGFTIFDFDHCAYGWRAYDLTALLGLWEFDSDLWRIFIAGYESMRSLSQIEKDLFPAFSILMDIWDMGDTLRMMPIWGEYPDDEYLNECLERLHNISSSEDLTG